MLGVVESLKTKPDLAVQKAQRMDCGPVRDKFKADQEIFAEKVARYEAKLQAINEAPKKGSPAKEIGRKKIHDTRVQ